MKPLRPTAILAAAILSSLAAAAVAQTGGVPPAATVTDQSQIVPSMIVVNARSATILSGKLTLDGVAPVAIVFADRPVRAAGHARIARLLEEWGDYTPDTFAKAPPNATMSVLNKATATLVNVVVTLRAAKLEGDRLTFDVEVLGGSLGNADGPASLFLDVVHLPMRQGMANRTAWYTSVR